MCCDSLQTVIEVTAAQAVRSRGQVRQVQHCLMTSKAYR